MLKSSLQDNGILVIEPSGALTEDDFNRVRALVDPWLDQGNTLHGLIIHTSEFPGWKNLSGLSAHFNFVRDHHRQLPRVAFVSDNRFLTALPSLGRHFVKAELRHFDADDLEKAESWILSAIDAEPAPKSLRHSWFPEQKLFWITATGKITSEEYKLFLDHLKPLVEEYSPVSFLINLDDFKGAELGALLADGKFGLSHIQNINKIALVGEQSWLHQLAKLPNPFSLKIKAFEEDSEHDAWEWISS